MIGTAFSAYSDVIPAKRGTNTNACDYWVARRSLSSGDHLADRWRAMTAIVEPSLCPPRRTRYDRRIAARRQKRYRGTRIVWSIKPLVRLRKESDPGVNIWRELMKTTLGRRIAALIACAGLGLAAPAFAQEKTVKIGVLNDMSSLYADIGGPNSVVAIKMAVEDSGLLKKGWKIDVLSGDHQNKPDVGVNIARQWLDSDKVDAIADTPNSGVALAVNNLVRRKRTRSCSTPAPPAPISPARPAPRTRSPIPTTPTCWPTAPARR
jgi:hypothetical protein